MPATPPGNNLTTIFQVGSYTSLTDTFTTVVDLNNGNPFYIHNSGLQMPQPTKTEIKSANVRTPGEIVTKVQYLNRHIVVQVWLRQSAGTAALMTSLRQLIAAIEHPPYTLRIAPPLGTLYTYADVVHVTHTIPSDAQVILAKAINHIEIDFECKPGLRGDRLYLQNLVANPGFDAPSAPGVVVFNDPLANLQSYVSTAGAAPTQSPANTYVDIVQANMPSLLRYYRFDESSGANAYDLGGAGQTASYVGSPTLSVAGAISGDTDTAISLNGTTQYVSIPTTGLPSGSAAFSLICWVKITANPTTNTRSVIFIGTSAASNEAAAIGINTSGQPVGFLWGGTNITGAALSLSTWHLLILTYSGGTNGTLTLYVDGASVGTPQTVTAAITYSGGVAQVGNSTSASFSFLPGSVDEAAIAGVALSSAQVTAIYNAGHTGATGTVSNALALATGAQVSFGSPAWSSLQTWQLRWRWVTGLTARFYLHYVDANDWLKVEVSQGNLKLIQNASGVLTTLLSSAPTLTHEAWYWLQMTQFPTPAATGWPVQVVLASDNEGAVGATLANGTLLPNGFATIGYPYSLGVGQPRLEASSAPLVVGGNFSSVHEVALWGPGSWYTNPGGGVYAISSGAWDQTPTNNYPNGPIISYGSARVDCAPSGEISYYWQSADSSSAARIQATAIPALPTTLYGAVVWVHSVGVGAGCVQSISVSEYDATGAFLRGGSLSGGASSATGAQSGWTQLFGTYTTGANCAYIILLLRVQDTTPGASANGTVWWDNIQWWNITQTGQGLGAMPYCELRFVQSPAMIVASGIAGDMPAPATMEIGVYLTSLAAGATANIIAGRRAQVGAGMRLLQASTGFNPTLDPTSYGGFNCPGANLGLVPYPATDEQGTYHVYGRAQSANAGFLSSVYIQPDVFTLQVPVGQQPTIADTSLAHWRGAQVFPFAAANTWQVVDVGPVTLPVYAPGNLSDLTQIAGDTATTSGTVGGHGTAQLTSNWIALMPDDAETLNALITNAAQAPGPITNEWLYLYADGTTGATTYSLEVGAIPNPAHGGGSGGVGIDTPAVQQIGSDVMYLDPTITTPGGAAAGSPGANGVNQICLIAVDSAANSLPVAVDIVYSPLYLWLR